MLGFDSLPLLHYFLRHGIDGGEVFELLFLHPVGVGPRHGCGGHFSAATSCCYCEKEGVEGVVGGASVNLVRRCARACVLILPSCGVLQSGACLGLVKVFKFGPLKLLYIFRLWDETKGRERP